MFTCTLRTSGKRTGFDAQVKTLLWRQKYRKKLYFYFSTDIYAVQDYSGDNITKTAPVREIIERQAIKMKKHHN
jgi:hypothetical protein